MARSEWGWLRVGLVLAGVAATGCGGEGGAEGGEGPGERVLAAPPDTVVSMASGLVGALVDMVVDQAGELYLLDAQANTVLRVDSTGRVLATAGGPGEGPGELRRPGGLVLRGDTLGVVDPGNARLQAFTREGAPAGSVPLPPCALGPSPPTPGAGGTFVAPTLGFDPYLARLCASDGEEAGQIGELVAPGQAMVDMAAMRAQVEEGEVPSLLLNQATPVAGADGSTWLVLSAAARVERHTPGGTLAFRLELDEPGHQEIRARWIRENAELDGFNVAGLRYLLDAREVGGDLWLLLGVADPEAGARVLVLSPGGEVRERIHFEGVRGAGRFAVDEARGWIYFYLPERAEVVGVGLKGMR